MSKLWQTTNTNSSDIVEAYTVGDDYIFDTMLVPYDVEGTVAHVMMLAKINVLSEEENNQVIKALDEIKKLHAEDNFKVLPEQEDCHTAIEQYVSEKVGEAGKKIHTGRSRNDQVLTMLRLYMKDVLAGSVEQLEATSQVFEQKSKEAQGIPMPGYTHLQKAMPTTVSDWLSGYGQAFNDLIPLLQELSKLIDQNPLGSAAGFGVIGLELDRDFTTQQLGFSKTQENPIYCGLSRGYFELMVMGQLELIMTLCGRLAQDMLIFTTQEFGYVSLPLEFTTGSSIMPNKRNYDPFEVMRGNAKVIAGYHTQVQAIVAGIGSGFQRDLQLTKEPFVKSCQITSSSLGVLIAAVPKLQIHDEKLKTAMSDDLYATEKVYKLVSQGVPFRDAYKQIKQELFGEKNESNQA